MERKRGIHFADADGVVGQTIGHAFLDGNAVQHGRFAAFDDDAVIRERIDILQIPLAARPFVAAKTRFAHEEIAELDFRAARRTQCDIATRRLRCVAERRLVGLPILRRMEFGRSRATINFRAVFRPMPFQIVLHHCLFRAFHVVRENIRDIWLDFDGIRHDGLLAILARQREISPAVAAMLRHDCWPHIPADGNAIRPYLLPISILHNVFLPEDRQTQNTNQKHEMSIHDTLLYYSRTTIVYFLVTILAIYNLTT